MDLCLVWSAVEEMIVPDMGRTGIRQQKSAIPCKNIQTDARGVLQRFDGIFSNSPGRCRDYCVETIPIRTGLSPQRQKIRSLGHAEEGAIWPYIEQMLKDGVISETVKEPLLVPIFTVPKGQSEEERPVLDFRKFNTLVRKEPFISQNRDHCISGVQQFGVGSRLDICQAFHHVPLGDDIEIGFSLRGRYYRYNRLPFGYCNSGFEFQRALFSTFARVRGKISSQLITYADDVLVLSKSHEEHARDLETVLSQMMEDGWRLKRSKCAFFEQEFTFLGMRLDRKGWRPEDESLGKLYGLRPPSSTKEWRQVKGWLNQLTRFVVRGQNVVAALDDAQRSGVPDDWKAFLECLERHTISIMHPTEHEEFLIGADASSVGWGAVLLQKGRGIIACASGTWRADQRHWKSNRLEVEAVVKGLTKFRPYTHGRRVVVFSDNSSVCSLLNAENTSDFVKRRLEIILEHNPDIRFIPGRSNILPDFLSRFPALCRTHQQQAAPLACRTDDQESEEELLRWGHRGHFSAHKTQQRIRRIGGHVQWKKVSEYVKRCRACQQFRQPRSMLPFGHLDGVEDVRDVVSCDFIGPLERGPGDVRYIFTMVDHLSRFGVAFKSRRSTTAAAVKFVEDFVERFGPIKRLMCDAASYFRSGSFSRSLGQMGTTIVMAPAHSHKSNGLCERFNQTLIGRIRRMRVSEGKRPSWTSVLAEAVTTINETPHDCTRYAPVDVWRDGLNRDRVDSETESIRVQSKRNTEESRKSTTARCTRGDQPVYPVGMKVWVFNHETFEALDKKFDPFWSGPFEITKIVSAHIREVFSSDLRKTMQLHVDSLQPFI